MYDISNQSFKCKEKVIENRNQIFVWTLLKKNPYQLLGLHESNDYNLNTSYISTKNRHHYARHSCAAQAQNIKKQFLHSHAFQ